MNILVPDSWLREFLVTRATPSQIKEYLSLCGPSVERIHKENGEVIYDIEVTSNRPDSMSVLGIAREAAAILPRFGIAAKLRNDPYAMAFKGVSLRKETPLKLTIKTDSKLNPRWTTVVLSNVTVGPSPRWLKEKLEATGIRSINNIIDITNYLMRAYGQPAHAFDYDEVRPGKEGVPTMSLRASRKGEKITTLDGKTRILPGDDIVIEDGSGRLIDLCGIMGGENSSIKSTTKNVVLFLQTYEPNHIRRTMMTLTHRTEAGSLFEKGTDPELVAPAILKGIKLIKDLAGGVPASKIYDIYPAPYKPYLVSVKREKVDSYLGIKLTDREIKDILTPLGFKIKVSVGQITIEVPSFRRDVAIDVDIIEELARIYGYHNLKTQLPEGEPPVVVPDQTLSWEEEIKTRLRDWGYTELYTYSMISDDLMGIFKLDKKKAYTIANPLSNEWVYMRPHLTPSVLASLKQNLNLRDELKLFELSMTYEYRTSDLPLEKSTLVVVWTGEKFYEAKGLAEALFKLFGIDFPSASDKPVKPLALYNEKYLNVGDYGSIGGVNAEILNAMGIDKPVTRLSLEVSKLVAHANLVKKYIPVPKYPASFEDIALIVPAQTEIGPVIDTLKKTHPLISDITLLDSYENIRTLHITYQSKSKNLTASDLHPVREKLLEVAESKFGARLKTV